MSTPSPFLLREQSFGKEKGVGFRREPGRVRGAGKGYTGGVNYLKCLGISTPGSRGMMCVILLAWSAFLRRFIMVIVSLRGW